MQSPADIPFRAVRRSSRVKCKGPCCSSTLQREPVLAVAALSPKSRASSTSGSGRAPTSRRYSRTYSKAVRSGRQSSSTRRRPAMPSRWRRSGDRISRSSAAAKAPELPAGTSRPVSSWATSEGIPPTLLAMTGIPSDIASMMLRGLASLNEGRTNTSAVLRTAPTSCR
jgi:hypothetical protein